MWYNWLINKSIKKSIMNVTKKFPQEDREELILASIPSNVTPLSPTQAQYSGPQVTPSTSTRKALHIQGSTRSNGQQTPLAISTHSAGPSRPHSTSSSDMANPLLESLRRIFFFF